MGGLESGQGARQRQRRRPWRLAAAGADATLLNSSRAELDDGQPDSDGANKGACGVTAAEGPLEGRRVAEIKTCRAFGTPRQGEMHPPFWCRESNSSGQHVSAN